MGFNSGCKGLRQSAHEGGKVVSPTHRPPLRQSAHESGKVSPTHRPPLPPGNIPGTHFC